jgi:hypothetical protein
MKEYSRLQLVYISVAYMILNTVARILMPSNKRTLTVQCFSLAEIMIVNTELTYFPALYQMLSSCSVI